MLRCEADEPRPAAVGKTVKSLRLFLGALALCAALATAQSPSPARLFQEAIHLMETKGDYPAALRLFEQIAKGSDRNLAARSLLSAGLCYERLGKREARNAYERLIRDFADQTGPVTAARARLAALTRAGGSPASRGMAAHRVLAEFPAFAALSHDGQRLSFPDWTTGTLAFMDLESKQKRSLTRKGTWDDSGEHAYGSVHSPDGKEIAYVWWNAQDILELRVVGLDGTGPRVLYRNADLHHLEVEDWSSDGRYILCNFFLKTGRSQIALVSVGNGAAQVLKTFDWPGPGKLSLSPDGRYVAYDLHGDIFLLAVRGTHEAVLVEHPANDFNPIWTPDGNRILFTSDRTGTFGTWVLSVVDGNPRGAPKLLRADMGKTWPVRFVRGDSYFYGVQTTMQDVYIAELDPETGKVTAPPSQASRRLVGANRWPDWSRDGKLLAFVSNQRPGGQDGSALSILSLETGKQEELYPRMTFISRLRWSPDGRSILASGRDERGRGGLYRIDAQTGEVSPVVQSGGLRFPWECAWSPDGRTIYYEMGAGIVARDLGTGRERRIRSDARHFALSPDGRFLAVPREDPPSKSAVLEIVALDTGQSRERLKVPDIAMFYKVLSWSADGRFLFFNKNAGRTTELWRVAVENGVSERLGIAMEGLLQVRVHPDGRRIAFSGWEYGGELWAMEQFLPAPEARKIAVEK
jgi:Tol biopolymer transport system component